MIDFTKTDWPPKDDADRIASYKRNEQLFDGDHATAFEERSAKMPDGMKQIIYLAVNMPGLVAKIAADFLFGEPPAFRVGEPKSKQQLALEDIVKHNDLHITFYEAALAASFRGDTVFRARVGKRKDSPKPQVIVEEVPAHSYFAETDPDNVRELLSESIAWTREDPIRGCSYLRVQTHTPGHISEAAYHLNPETGKVSSRVDLGTIYDNPPDEETDTGLDTSLLVHIPNYRHGSIYYGISDYEDLITLFDGLNNRLTKIDRILDHHSDPKLIGVPGMMDARGAVDVSKISYIEGDSDLFKYLPRYLTWDGQLEAAFRELEQILYLICHVAEISPAAVGLDDKSGGAVDSGVALRLRYLNTEHKCNRKKLYFNRGVKRLLKLAMDVGAQVLGGPSIDDEPEVTWQDGLPQIYAEAVTTEVARVAGGLSSKVSAIQRIDQCSAAEAEEEVKRMEDEADAGPEPVSLEDWLNGGKSNPPPGMDPTPPEQMPPPQAPAPKPPAPKPPVNPGAAK